MEQLNFIYDAGETRRFHTVPVLRHQNIADHSWHVAMLAFMLYGQEEPGVTMSFMMACLTHDMAECKTGDLPAPAKRGMGELFKLQDAKEPVVDKAVSFREAWGIMEQRILNQYAMDWEHLLTQEEQRRLKVCDAIEGAMYCLRERTMGNQVIKTCFENFMSYIGELMDDCVTDERPPHIEREWDLFMLLGTSWSVASA